MWFRYETGTSCELQGMLDVLDKAGNLNKFLLVSIYFYFDATGTQILIVKFSFCQENFSNFQDQAAKDKALQSMAAMSSAQIVSASAIHSKAVGLPGLPPGFNPSSVRPGYPGAPPNVSVSKENKQKYTVWRSCISLYHSHSSITTIKSQVLVEYHLTVVLVQIFFLQLFLIKNFHNIS